MKVKMMLAAAVVATGGLAQAAVEGTYKTDKVDLNFLQANPMELLSILGDRRDHEKKDTDHKDMKMPQACTDAAITDDQKVLLKEAVYQSKREKVQLDANLKLAFLTYGHTVGDLTSDLAAAQAAATQITEAIAKMGDNHLALANRILYDIVKPEQRAKTFRCLIAIHKMHRHGKRK